METFGLENIGVNVICGAYKAEVLLLCSWNRSSDEEFSLFYDAVSPSYYTAGIVAGVQRGSNLP